MQGPFHISALPEHLSELDGQKLVDLCSLVRIIGTPVRDGQAKIAVLSGEEEIGVTVTTDEAHVRMSVGLGGVTPEDDAVMIFLSVDSTSYVIWDQRVSLRTLDTLVGAYRNALAEAGK